MAVARGALIGIGLLGPYYQLPACLSAGVTVVISPIHALILEHIHKLTELGVKARTFVEDHGDLDAERIYHQLVEVKLLYITPEKMRMSGPLFKALKSPLGRGLLARFVIDEAHCISQWGSNFRPDYGTLNELQRNFPGVPIMAVSGPIAPHIQEDILERLQMTNPQVFRMIFIRKNLKYAVKTRKNDGEEDCITWIKEHYPHDSGIVYCWRSDICDSMALKLEEEGLLACSYHSEMSDEDRESVQNKWK
ncbi:unnamed protein product [Boreogadus saida]